MPSGRWLGVEATGLLYTFLYFSMQPDFLEDPGTGDPLHPDCSQSCSQLVIRSLPSVQLLTTDILDHPQAPLGRRVAEEGVEGSWSGENLPLLTVAHKPG